LDRTSTLRRSRSTRRRSRNRSNTQASISRSPSASTPSKASRAPTAAAIQIELRRKSVTLPLLREEYFLANPNGYSYTKFVELYGAHARGKSDQSRQNWSNAGGSGSAPELGVFTRRSGGSMI
jgi:hypothetical protein